jgi:diguanylate cyclase (GGDEF)-like protein/PAS domain S-box-containing protein
MIVLAGVGVVATMVVVTETARSDQQHHMNVEMLVSNARAASQQIGEFAWQGVALARSADAAHQFDTNTYLTRGLSLWGSLNASISALKAADHSPMTMTLVNDANRVFRAGLATLPYLGSYRNVSRGMEETLSVFTPELDRLDQDAVAADMTQARVADHAASRANVAYVCSLVIGTALLTLLGWRLYRMRRRTLIVEQQHASDRRAEERIRALIEHSNDMIMVLAPDLTVRWRSPTINRMLGHDADAVLGRRLTEFVDQDDTKSVEAQIAAAIGKSDTVSFTARFRHQHGGCRDLEVIAENRLDDPLIEGVLLSARDITQRKALEDELRHQAFHDGLTGLANRALFEDRLAHALARARRHGHTVAVLFIDLDDFKTINDSLGHSSGDELLRAVAMRIGTIVRATDTAARLGGDEFGVMVEGGDEESESEAVAERLLDALRPPFQIAGRDLQIAASIGVAESDTSATVDELLRNADTAMYAAKDAGKGNVKLYEGGMHQRVLDRLELTGELQRALAAEQFELDYQPIVDLRTGHIHGAEALVRWAHPERGRLAPAHFIGLAEETGLIVPLGTWVLRTACAQAAQWQRDFPGHTLQMNVNVSTRQLHDPVFPGLVETALRDTGFAAEQLVLEITESMLPEDSGEIIDQLERLKAIGVKLAVDDFGTGYSALSRLRAYPIDILKIDRSFIDGIDLDADKRELVRGILDLSQSLHMSTVAEGIEHSRQADELLQMSSALGQGFALSRPVSSQRIRALLESSEPLLPTGSTDRTGT